LLLFETFGDFKSPFFSIDIATTMDGAIYPDEPILSQPEPREEMQLAASSSITSNLISYNRKIDGWDRKYSLYIPVYWKASHAAQPIMVCQANG